MSTVQHVALRYWQKPVEYPFVAYSLKSPNVQKQYLDAEINGHKAKFPNQEKSLVLFRKIQVHFRAEQDADYFSQQSHIDLNFAWQFL